MRRSSTSSLIATAHGRACRYVINENDDPPSRWHDAQCANTNRDISRLHVIFVEMGSCADAHTGSNRMARFQRTQCPPAQTTRQMEFDPSSLTISDPSGATATPTGRPHTSPLGATKPVMKFSKTPLAWPFSSGTRITS